MKEEGRNYKCPGRRGGREEVQRKEGKTRDSKKCGKYYRGLEPGGRNDEEEGGNQEDGERKGGKNKGNESV